MYLTRLLLNPRHRRVRQEVARPYEIHRTLMQCFPDDLSPTGERLLFRVETPPPTRAITLLMQTLTAPTWGWLERPVARGYLASSDLPNPWVKTFEPRFKEGQVLAFRLLANPTVKRAGKRRGLYRKEDQRAWLVRKARVGGFRVGSVRSVGQGTVVGSIHRGDRTSHQLRFLSVRFDGLLQVTDPDVFLETLRRRIGSGKGLGFGLLSVARPRRY